MYNEQVLGLAEAQAALRAIFDRVSEDPSLPTVSAAVVDSHGDLIACMRMDGAHARETDMAIKMAYTAARMRRDTTYWKEFLQKSGWVATDFGTDVTPVHGGVCITKPGVERKRTSGKIGPVILGAIGVGGRGGGNEALAFVGLKALQKACWGESD